MFRSSAELATVATNIDRWFPVDVSRLIQDYNTFEGDEVIVEVKGVFVAKLENGSLAHWGKYRYTQNYDDRVNEVITKINKDFDTNPVVSLLSTQGGFVVLLQDGQFFLCSISVVLHETNMVAIYSSPDVCSTMSKHNKVTVFNLPRKRSQIITSDRIVKVCGVRGSFIALTEHGHLVGWGDYTLTKAWTLSWIGRLCVKNIYSTSNIFAIHMENDDVVINGKYHSGIKTVHTSTRIFVLEPNDNSNIIIIEQDGSSSLLKQYHNCHVISVRSTCTASHAILFSNGRVIIRGSTQGLKAIQSMLKNQVRSIHSTNSQFAAILNNDKVVLWNFNRKATIDSIVYDLSSQGWTCLANRARTIHSLPYCFVAVLHNGNKIVWK